MKTRLDRGEAAVPDPQMKYSQVENRIPRFVDPHKKQASAGVLEKKKMPDSREKRSNQRKHQPYTRQYTGA
jgi:hypothetical protein